MDPLDAIALGLILSTGIAILYQAATEDWARNETVGWTVFWVGGLLAVLPDSVLSAVPFLVRWGEIPAALVMLVGISIQTFWQPKGDAENV